MWKNSHFCHLHKKKENYTLLSSPDPETGLSSLENVDIWFIFLLSNLSSDMLLISLISCGITSEHILYRWDYIIVFRHEWISSSGLNFYGKAITSPLAQDLFLQCITDLRDNPCTVPPGPGGSLYMDKGVDVWCWSQRSWTGAIPSAGNILGPWQPQPEISGSSPFPMLHTEHQSYLKHIYFGNIKNYPPTHTHIFYYTPTPQHTYSIGIFFILFCFIFIFFVLSQIDIIPITFALSHICV